jgi:hypothetical protein
MSLGTIPTMDESFGATLTHDGSHHRIDILVSMALPNFIWLTSCAILLPKVDRSYRDVRGDGENVPLEFGRMPKWAMQNIPQLMRVAAISTEKEHELSTPEAWSTIPRGPLSKSFVDADRTEFVQQRILGY